MLEIRVAGREIRGDVPDRTRMRGLVVKPNGFQGWQGMSSTRREALARAVQHGEHDTPVRLGSRIVTIDGWVLGDDPIDVGELSDSLTGLFAAERTRVTITHQGKTLWAFGRAVVAECDDSGLDPLVSEFQLQLVFADPRKYGDVATLPGDRLDPPISTATATSVDVFHYGNFPAFPVIVIPTAPAAYSITAGGKTFTVAGATPGGTHEVHLRNGRVYRNGTEMPRVGKGDLWTVPPYATVTHAISVPGRVKIADTSV